MDKVFVQLLTAMLLAHFICDFIIPFHVKNHGKLPLLLQYLIHSLIHGIATYLLLGFWAGWLVPGLIMASHFIINLAENYWQKKTSANNAAPFLAGQLAHLIVITLLTSLLLLPEGSPFWYTLLVDQALPISIHALALLILIPVGGVIIGKIVAPFKNQLKSEPDPKIKDGIELSPSDSLKDGGKLIGWLERILIFVFVINSHFEAVGFLMAAKSVFRFGDLKESRDRKETEYIMIGTFASFLLAILIALLTKTVVEAL